MANSFQERKIVPPPRRLIRERGAQKGGGKSLVRACTLAGPALSARTVLFARGLSPVRGSSFPLETKKRNKEGREIKGGGKSQQPEPRKKINSWVRNNFDCQGSLLPCPLSAHRRGPSDCAPYRIFLCDESCCFWVDERRKKKRSRLSFFFAFRRRLL